MKIEVGTEYQISEKVKQNFNSAEALTIIRHTGEIVQFTLKDKKSYGSMPQQHLEHLVKKQYLTRGINKRHLLADTDEEQIV